MRDRFQFAAVCVYPAYVQGSWTSAGEKSKVCTVIGFPTGATTSAVKLYEAQDAVENGATELDVVINLGCWKLKNRGTAPGASGNLWGNRTNSEGNFETTLLTDAENDWRLNYVWMRGSVSENQYRMERGATVADVRLLKRVAREQAGIKASGNPHYWPGFELILRCNKISTSRGPDDLIHNAILWIKARGE